MSMIVAIVVFVTSNWNLRIKHPAFAILSPFMLIIFIFLTACSDRNVSSISQVYLPSLSRDLRIQNDLTYGGMAIVNDTSARLIRINKTLSIEGEVLESYESLDDGKKYRITLKKDYISVKNENLGTHDVLFTIKWYLIYNSEMAMQLRSIVGAKNCLATNCKLPGVKLINDHQMEVSLVKTDHLFIDKFSSPWMILLKKGKPAVEQIGNCQVPYQTGLAQITKCDASGIEIDYPGKKVIVQNKNRAGKNIAVLLTEHPSDHNYSSLTVMSAFANPESKTLSRKQRIRIMTNIRAASHHLASALKLNHSSTIAPQWLLNNSRMSAIPVTKKKINCPRQPISILLDTSLPKHHILKNYLARTIECPLIFNITEASSYFKNFKNNDIGIAWFTPDFLTVYNIFTIFDCPDGFCYFNWKDSKLNNLIAQIRESAEQGNENINLSSTIETHLLNNGIATPIADMNWWIQKKESINPVHQAGLFQLRIRDFL